MLYHTKIENDEKSNILLAFDAWQPLFQNPSSHHKIKLRQIFDETIKGFTSGVFGNIVYVGEDTDISLLFALIIHHFSITKRQLYVISKKNNKRILTLQKQFKFTIVISPERTVQDAIKHYTQHFGGIALVYSQKVTEIKTKDKTWIDLPLKHGGIIMWDNQNKLTIKIHNATINQLLKENQNSDVCIKQVALLREKIPLIGSLYTENELFQLYYFIHHEINTATDTIAFLDIGVGKGHAFQFIYKTLSEKFPKKKIIGIGIDPYNHENLTEQIKQKSCHFITKMAFHAKDDVLALLKKLNVIPSLIFMDGDPSEEACLVDYAIYLPLLARGGGAVFNHYYSKKIETLYTDMLDKRYTLQFTFRTYLKRPKVRDHVTEVLNTNQSFHLAKMPLLFPKDMSGAHCEWPNIPGHLSGFCFIKNRV